MNISRITDIETIDY